MSGIRNDLADGILVYLLGDAADDNVLVLDKAGEGYEVCEITIGGDIERRADFETLSGALHYFASQIAV
jgi:hypothetical protein